MDKKDKRKSERVAINKTLKIKSCDLHEKEGLLVTLISVNLSENGISFESTQPYDIGTHYIIRFTGRDKKLYDIRIEIIRVKEVITHTQYNIGAKFLETDADKIKRFIE
ncbi:MAG: PilZ domain-containing protein [Proteobacteria bacterium]|nr:PilZ domain-containing protein [Pseudomonadota bacterium]MBU1583560.1 PilZ domain-containing protein [Pseudomonadota bacterium]MBU2455405.1 PilZ domain-containing protein [Pseudomonadota bacterium]MBU2629983.1 PilZ domain-containing protein [Pseudomonadota bacterium]